MTNKSSSFAILQRIGKAFMLPIALLPAAGILLGVGGAFTNSTMIQAYNLDLILGDGTILNSLLIIMRDTGDIIFSNLPLIFAVGISVGLAKLEKGTAGLAGAIGFLVMHKAISSVLSIRGITAETTTITYLTEKLRMEYSMAIAYSQRYSTVLGIFTLQMSVLGGMIAGFTAAGLHNRFYDIKLPQFLGFFGGSRFVPIITTFTMLIIGMLLTFIWPPVQSGIGYLGIAVEQTGYVGTFIYGMIERSLIPFGLHHVFYMPFWQTPVGGIMEIDDRIVSGAQNIFFAQLADPSTDHFEVARGTRFMAGKFPFMMFGLPGAALAMYHTAFPERKKEIGSLLISVAFTSFLTGITEPIEFAFLFVAPILYYGVHVPLCGLSFMLMHILNVGVGQTFSGGFIDFFLFGVLQGNAKTDWIMIPLVGIVYFALYYLIFTFVIRKFNLETPGRERASEVTNNNYSGARKIDTNLRETSLKTLEGLGGQENISYVDACITKLRVTVKNPEKVKDDNYFKALGAKGVVRKNDGIQVVFGTLSDNIKIEIEKIIHGL